MGGSKLSSERRHSIASVITGSFLFSENQAEISMATKLSFFFSQIQLYARIKTEIVVTKALKNLHCSLPSLYLSDVDKTKLMSSRRITIKFTHAKEMKLKFTHVKEMKQSCIKSTDYMNKQFSCRQLLYKITCACTLKYQWLKFSGQPIHRILYIS